MREQRRTDEYTSLARARESSKDPLNAKTQQVARASSKGVIDPYWQKRSAGYIVPGGLPQGLRSFDAAGTPPGMPAHRSASSMTSLQQFRSPTPLSSAGSLTAMLYPQPSLTTPVLSGGSFMSASGRLNSMTSDASFVTMFSGLSFADKRPLSVTESLIDSTRDSATAKRDELSRADKVDQLRSSFSINIMAGNTSESNSPLSSSPLSPPGPYEWHRYGVRRDRRLRCLGGGQDNKFELLSKDGQMLMCARRDQRSPLTYLVHVPDPNHQGVHFLGALQANIKQNRFLLVGCGGSNLPNALDPNVDPVLMVVTFGKSPDGHRQVMVILPGERTRKDLTALAEHGSDLGTLTNVEDMLKKLQRGEAVPGVKVLRSKKPSTSKQRRKQELDFEGRVTRASTKNLQLTIESRLASWPSFGTSQMDRHLEPKQGAANGERQGMLVFQCGRNEDSFICDHAPRMMSMLQAFGIAVCTFTHKLCYSWL
ncbi:hypothetical protein WJX72_008870 [[Myrmecia] bisecta]|uniref:Tubby C-terminal domain-containing protein n=1 Tax=[Myrmecia] bisecta TaxID=41462 RepID=A0AAW1PXF2_9CHLO